MFSLQIFKKKQICSIIILLNNVLFFTDALYLNMYPRLASPCRMFLSMNLVLLLILKGLKPNKAHGWDGISIRMIQMCGDAILAPLSIIYKNCISKRVFPSVLKMANVVPIYKKNKKIYTLTIAQSHFCQYLVKSLSV